MNQALLDRQGVTHIVCNKLASLWHVTVYDGGGSRSVGIGVTIDDAFAEAERLLIIADSVEELEREVARENKL